MGGFCSKSCSINSSTSTCVINEDVDYTADTITSDISATCSSLQQVNSSTIPLSNPVDLVNPITLISCKKSKLLDDNDVMVDIFQRLPLKSLLRFKSVCKSLNHLISDPFFISSYSHKNPDHTHQEFSGFFLQKFVVFELYSRLDFIRYREDTLNPTKADTLNPTKASLSFIKDDGGVYLLHSCNGLLLCSSFHCQDEDRKYYICKPTIRQYQQFPKPKCRVVFSLNIAYDPTISAHYKILCICDSESSKNLWKVKIYESDAGKWKNAGNDDQVFDFPAMLLTNRGVYCNGALHWVGKGEFSFRFEIEQELVLETPMPPIPQGRKERRLEYFGESGGHLYLVEKSCSPTSFTVMEMKSDCSGWFGKYHVEPSSVTNAFPAAVMNLFSIVHIVDRRMGSGDDDDNSFMVLHFPGKFVSYNLKKGIVMESVRMPHDETDVVSYSWKDIHPYVNTLCYF